MDCIQTTAPGSAILPIATFDDLFDTMNDEGEEAKRRNRVMIRRLREVEEEVRSSKGAKRTRFTPHLLNPPRNCCSCVSLRSSLPQRVKDLKAKLEAFRKRGERGAAKALYLDKLLELRPNFIVGKDDDDPVIRISCDINRKLQFQGNDSGFGLLTKRMVEVTSMKKKR